MEIGLRVEPLESDKVLQDLVLTVHHAYMHTFSFAPCIKITENHKGIATVLQMQIAPQPAMMFPPMIQPQPMPPNEPTLPGQDTAPAAPETEPSPATPPGKDPPAAAVSPLMGR